MGWNQGHRSVSAIGGPDNATLTSTSLTLLGRIAPRGERAEIVVTALVVAIIFAMLLPVPTWLLDGLIALNLCTSAFLIVLVMQVKETTGLSAFPSLFLVTTLFRVALSVASTRLILLEGEAGHIISAFGEIVVGGNLVVGLVIFLVLTVVQFIVITKGSERVAEVGARFSLDAMPGRQMAIDMERKANGISQDEAKRQRDLLTEESQFFGAMDGTMKFAKGDSIVGIVIVLVNLIGGLSVGVLQRGMSAGDALQHYAILTVGDGLVAQIPALLMSMTAGLLVTRVSKPSGGQNIGKELTAQLVSQPKAWVTASGAMLAFGALPGMPLPIFAGLAAASAAVGLHAIHGQLKRQREAAAKASEGVPELRTFDIVRPFLVRVSDRVAPEASRRVVRQCQTTRNELLRHLGLVTPSIEPEERLTHLEDADIEFCHGEVRVFAMSLREHLKTFSWVDLDTPLPELPEDQIEHGAGLMGSTRVWMTEEQLAGVSVMQVDLTDAWGRLDELITDAMLRHGPFYMGLEEAQKIVNWASIGMAEVAKELERAVPLSRLAEVLRRLLAERVSIRNLTVILQALIDWGPRERDPLVLTECVRGMLQRDICAPYVHNRELRAVMLDTELESLLRASVRQTAYGDFLAVDADTSDLIINETRRALLQAVEPRRSVVIVCAQDIRVHVRKLLADHLPEVPVIGLSELPADFRVNVRSVVTVPVDHGGYADDLH